MGLLDGKTKLFGYYPFFYLSNWMHNQFKTYKIDIKILLHISVNKPSSGSLLPYFAKVAIIKIVG
jgi:hypothetical protein